MFVRSDRTYIVEVTTMNTKAQTRSSMRMGMRAHTHVDRHRNGMVVIHTITDVEKTIKRRYRYQHGCKRQRKYVIGMRKHSIDRDMKIDGL